MSSSSSSSSRPRDKSSSRNASPPAVEGGQQQLNNSNDHEPEQQQQQQPIVPQNNSSYAQQMEDANRELEAAIAANESFRKHVLEPGAANSNYYATTPADSLLPSSATYRGGLGSYSTSLLAKWAAVPATAAPISGGGNINNNTSSTSASSHHSSRLVIGQPQPTAATRLNNINNNINNNIQNASGLFYRPACQCDNLDSLLQAAMLKEAERVDTQTRDVIARDADARAQHLDNVLRGKFAELQAHNESTGKVLQLIGESLKTLKQENNSLSKTFEEKTSKTLESVRESQKDQTSRVADALERMERRLSGLEETMQQERVNRQTRLDALELRLQELRSAVFTQIEKKTQDVRDEMRTLDADFSVLHREWTKASNGAEEIRHIKNAMREMIEDSTGLRSDVRQIKSDVLNLDVFMKVRAQNIGSSNNGNGIIFGDSTNRNHQQGSKTNKTSNGNSYNNNVDGELQTLRESVSFLAASMKHHGILSVDGPSIFEMVVNGNNSNNNNNDNPSYFSRNQNMNNHQQSQQQKQQQHSSFDFLFNSSNQNNNNNNNNNDNQHDAQFHKHNDNVNYYQSKIQRHHQQQQQQQQQHEDPSLGAMNTNQTNKKRSLSDDAAASAAAFRNSLLNSENNNVNENNNNINNYGTIPPLASTPKNQTAFRTTTTGNNNQYLHNQNRNNNLTGSRGSSVNEDQDDEHENEEISSGNGVLASGDEDDRLVRSPID